MTQPVGVPVRLEQTPHTTPNHQLVTITHAGGATETFTLPAFATTATTTAMPVFGGGPFFGGGFLAGTAPAPSPLDALVAATRALAAACRELTEAWQ
jgi:hypothetical protein